MLKLIFNILQNDFDQFKISYTSNTNKFIIQNHKNNKDPLNLTLIVTDSSSQTITNNFSLVTRNTSLIQKSIQGDFAINTTPDQQTIDYIILLSNQNIFMIWESYLEDGSDFGIFAKIINQQGTVLAPQFRINTYTNGGQSFPQYTVLTNGSLLIVWESMDEDGSNLGLYAKVFDANGNVIREEFRINSWTNDEQSTVSVITLNNGNLFFTWQSYDQDGSKYGVYGRIIDQSGTDIKSEFQVNEWTSDSQKNAKLAKFPGGNVLVVWMSRYQDGDGYGIYGKIYLQNGDVSVSEKKINVYTTGDQVNPSILLLSNGNALITWESYLQDGSMDGLYAIIIDSSFNLIASEFRLNDYSNLEQRTIQMAVLPNGNVFLAWESQRQPSNNFGIFAKIIDQTGNTVVSEFHVNDNYLANQGFCQVAVVDQKFIFIGWESQGQDASGDGIYFKIIDFNGNSIISEQRLNSYMGGWQINLRILPLSGKNLLLAWNKDIGGYDFDCYGQITTLDYNLVPDVLCSDVTLSADSTQNFNYLVDSNCFIDYDGSQISISSALSNGSNLPNWISYHSTSKALTGLLPSDYYQNLTIAILASDNYNSSNSLLVNIINNNKPPISNNTNQTNSNQSNNSTNNQTNNTTPEIAIAEGNNLMMIAAAAGGGGLLLLILIIFLIRRRKKVKTTETPKNNTETTKIHPEPSPRENDALTDQRDLSRNPFTTTNVPQNFLCPLTGGIMSEPWIVTFLDDTKLTFEKEPLFAYFDSHNTIPVKHKPKKHWEEDTNMKLQIENYLLDKTAEEFTNDRDLMLKTLEWIQLRGKSKLMKNPRLMSIVERVQNKNIPN